jgi:3alpha(or 20beta)-hydroxysteroid dehydrogenase
VAAQRKLQHEKIMQLMNNKTVLITGASGGQGSAEAKLFSKEGASVVVTDLAQDRLDQLTREISNEGGKAVSAVLDVRDEAQWIAAIDLAKREFGRLDALVNNAGTISRQGIRNTALSDWHRTLDVNLTGAMLGIKHSAPLMQHSGGGSIINVSSTAGMTAHYDAAYCASKWGLRGLTKMASIELAEWNIRVNSIHPGVIEDTSFSREGAPGQAEAARRAVPMQRQGTPQECANLVLYLASDQSTYITGAEIAIDGGYTAGGAIWLRSKMRDALASGQIS